MKLFKKHKFSVNQSSHSYLSSFRVKHGSAHYTLHGNYYDKSFKITTGPELKADTQMKSNEKYMFSALHE